MRAAHLAFALIALAQASDALATSNVQLLLTGSHQRLAVDPQLIDSRSQLNDLRKSFELADKVSLGDLKNWLSGRCFFIDSPTTPVASLLVVEADMKNRDNGPAFTSAQYRRITPLVNHHASADFFDSLEEIKTKSVAGTLRRHQSTNSYPTERVDSLVVDGYRTSELEARRYTIRKKGGFVYLELTCAENGSCLNYQDEEPTSHILGYYGDVVAMCYYFKNVGAR